MRSEYSRWDGTQIWEDDEVEDADLVDEISDDILSGIGPERALQRLMRRGIPGRMRGLDELSRRMAEARRKWAERTSTNANVSQYSDRLKAILDQEKAALADDPRDGARFRETQLDLLPSSPAAAIRQLMNYEFADPQAKQAFDQLVEDIRRELLQAQFGRLMGAMQNVSAEDVARMREMLSELNSMIEARNNGEPYDFDGFMQRYGDMFPENPQNLDELLEALARRMAAMSRFLASLSPEQRRELEELQAAVMNDMDFEFEMALLEQEMQALAPNLPWGEAAYGYGDEPMGLSETVEAFERLGEMEEVEQALRGRHAGASIADVDEAKLQRALDEQAVADLRELKRIEKALERAGVVAREGGKLELTARGIRQLGERALVKVFEVLQHDRPGSHEDRSTGGASEPTGATRPWRFDEDMGEISVQKTVFNAVTRNLAGGRTGGVKLHPDDFELIEAESRTRTATALLLDLSFSMPLRGHWVAAKKMALALHALIEGKYPQDDLYLIGFSDYARRLDPQELTIEGTIERVYGTNMQHAFLLARRLLSQHPGATRQVIMVTDGEPTAHLVESYNGGVEATFRWPPTSETIHKTLAEATRLSSSGITLNIYMLEEDEGLTRFMDELAHLTGGRVFHAAGHDIGQFVLRDFVKYR
ncbi:MAG TPA: hypothetical protein VHJ78_13585 [Actinomycetota bacterium]|nr:hypothetical protein [Actinomycetota bacterium]